MIAFSAAPQAIFYSVDIHDCYSDTLRMLEQQRRDDLKVVHEVMEDDWYSVETSPGFWMMTQNNVYLLKDKLTYEQMQQLQAFEAHI